VKLGVCTLLASLSEDMRRLDGLFAPYPHSTSPIIRAVLTAKLTVEPTLLEVPDGLQRTHDPRLLPVERASPRDGWTVADGVALGTRTDS